MATRQTKNSKYTGMIIPSVCLLILFYFGFHAFQGNLGVKSRAQMEREDLQLQFELVRLKTIRRDLEKKVHLLRDGSLEKDMLDQQARHMLNLVGANEFVILLK